MMETMNKESTKKIEAQANDAYRPWRASPPGDTIDDMVEESCRTLDGLARSTGVSRERLDEIRAGTVAIDDRTAAAFERVLGSTKDYWLKRSASYQAFKANEDRACQTTVVDSHDQPWEGSGYVSRHYNDKIASKVNRIGFDEAWKRCCESDPGLEGQDTSKLGAVARRAMVSLVRRHVEEDECNGYVR